MFVLRGRDAIQHLRRFASLAVRGCEPDCQMATVLVVSELAENILKYGTPSAHAGAGTIIIDVENELVRVRAENVVGCDADARHVVDAISHLSSSDAHDLYCRRMRELFESPTLPRARLGLLRIACEARFRLACAYQANVLQITAERRRGAR